MTEEIDKKVMEKKERLEKGIGELEEIRNRFISETMVFVKEWYRKQAEYMVIRKANRSIELGIDKVNEMKKEVQELIEQSDSLVLKHLSDPKLWWHLSIDSDHWPDREFEINLGFRFSGNRAPDHLNKAIRYTLGQLGPILEEFGYISNDYHDRHAEIWRRDSYADSVRPDSPAYYPYSLDWSKSMKDIIEDYSTKLEETSQVDHEIRSLEIKKKEHIAKEMWDSGT